MATHSSILAWRVLWTRSLAGHRVAKSQTQPFLVRICFSNLSMWVRLFCNLHIFFLFLVVLFSKNEIQCAFPVYWVWATLKWPIPWKLGGSPLHLRWCVLGALRGTLLPPCFWIRSSPVSTGKTTLSAKLKDFNNEPCVPLPFLFTAFPLQGMFRGVGVYYSHGSFSPKQCGHCWSSQGPRMAFSCFDSSMCLLFFVTLTLNRWTIDFIEAHSRYIWWFPTCLDDGQTFL